MAAGLSPVFKKNSSGKMSKKMTPASRNIFSKDSTVACRVMMKSSMALAPERAAKSVDVLHDLLRRLGDLTADEVSARITEPAAAADWLTVLEKSRRAVSLRIAGETRWIAIEDAARYRDGLGVALPVGIERYLPQ